MPGLRFARPARCLATFWRAVASRGLRRRTWSPERCPRLSCLQGSARRPGSLRFAQAQATKSEVRLTYIGHSTFLIESPAGVTIATDYNDAVRPSVMPRIATMNIAHSTHLSYNPDPGIEYLLPGWGEDGQAGALGPDGRRRLAAQRHDQYPRRLVRESERDKNSMFVFEVAGLCILHLGHLHHVLTEDHLKALGRIDVVLAPVDGSYTLDVDGMIETLAGCRRPGHSDALFRRVDAQPFPVPHGRGLPDRAQRYATVVLSRDSLPVLPTVLVLPGILSDLEPANAW